MKDNSRETVLIGGKEKREIVVVDSPVWVHGEFLVEPLLIDSTHREKDGGDLVFLREYFAQRGERLPE